MWGVGKYVFCGGKKKIDKFKITDESVAMRRWEAWLRFYFKIDTSLLTEDEVIERWCELEYCLKQLGKIQ